MGGAVRWDDSSVLKLIQDHPNTSKTRAQLTWALVFIDLNRDTPDIQLEPSTREHRQGAQRARVTALLLYLQRASVGGCGIATRSMTS